MTSYSVDYLQGLKDGRASLKMCENAEEINRACRSDLQFIERVKGCAYSEIGADYLTGLKDFWDHQRKIGKVH